MDCTASSIVITFSMHSSNGSAEFFSNSVKQLRSLSARYISKFNPACLSELLIEILKYSWYSMIILGSASLSSQFDNRRIRLVPQSGSHIFPLYLYTFLRTSGPSLRYSFGTYECLNAVSPCVPQLHSWYR